METISAGLALFDYDGDGDIDIYFLNGAPLRGSKADVKPRNALYRNDGDFKFTDVTDRSGSGDTGFGLGVTVGDYNNDGHPDIYLNNYGPNVLYRNNGDGTFTDATAKAGVANGDQVGAGTSFLDIDADGDLDLYVSNYVRFSYEEHVNRHVRGIPLYVGPMTYGPVPDTLYRNKGDGTFEDVSEKSGIAAHAGTGMGTVCADYDHDGDTDIIVGNDGAGNFVFQNDGKGKFKEVGLQSGLAYDSWGVAHGTMGVECADFDNDGRLDFYMTSYERQFATLYRNKGAGLFEDVTRTTGAGAGTYAEVTWGAALADFDNDGDRDIFVASGHLHDNVHELDNSKSYPAPNVLLRNSGKKFTNVTQQSGDGLKVVLSSRGAAFDDLDNDGDLDAVILNSRREPTILRNDSANKNHWIQIQLKGTKSNRDGVGAQVRVITGDRTQVDELHSGRGYQSHYGTRLHFGLGATTKIDRIEVHWIGGPVTVLKDILTNQTLTITER
jgi:hypothetical protein